MHLEYRDKCRSAVIAFDLLVSATSPAHISSDEMRGLTQQIVRDNKDTLL